MEFEKTGIYPYIKDHLDQCQMIHVAPGDYIARASDATNKIFYLIEGKCRETAITQAGKTVNVDVNVEDEFTGHLSNHWGQNLYCDMTAITRCTVVFIPQALFRQLMRDESFQAFFYRKTSTRLYEMYKMTLAREIFTQAQLFAWYMLESTSGSTCEIESIEAASRELHISRRNLYNLIESATKAGILTRVNNKTFEVLNREELEKTADPVKKYMMNEM